MQVTYKEEECLSLQNQGISEMLVLFYIQYQSLKRMHFRYLLKFCCRKVISRLTHPLS